MTDSEIIELFCSDYYTNFAVVTADKILQESCFEQFYILHLNCKELNLSPNSLSKFIFRSSYVLEVIYFKDKSLFLNHIDNFSLSFTLVENESSKRHYGKICADMLRCGFALSRRNEIARKSLEWVLDVNCKVAVKIWAIDILILLKDDVDFVREYLPVVIQNVSMIELPSIQVRMRKWKKHL